MKFLARNLPSFAALAVFLLAYAIGAASYDAFLSSAVLINLLRDNAFLGLAAVGMTFVIISGGIDLSVGAMIGFTSIFVATLMEVHGLPPHAAIPLALAVGALFGTGMGTIIAIYRVPAFLVTLAGMFLARGAGFVISLESIGLSHPLYMQLGTERLFLPVLFVGTLLAGAFVLQYRPFGRAVYAIGGSEASAHLMGVPVRRTQIAVYSVSGLTAALAGVAHGFYTISGNATAGTMLELDCIAAVVIGGTLLQGGVGNMLGTFIGVALLGLIQTVIIFQGTLSSWWTRIIIGVLMLAFILMQRAIEASMRAREARMP